MTQTQQPSPLCAGSGPQALATGQGRLSGLALDGDSVYFTSPANGLVGKVGKSGGAVVALAAMENQPDSLAVDSVQVYWTTGDHKTIRKLARGGGAPSTLTVSPVEMFGAIAADGTSVYFSGGGLMKVGAGGGQPTHLADLPEGARWLRVHAGEVYLLTNYMLYRAPSAGGAATQLGDTNYMFGLDVDDSGIYYAITRTISEMPLAGGAASPLLEDTTGVTDGIAVDDRFVYWTTADSVMRVAKSGGAPSAIATAQAQPRSVLVDGSSLYWLNAGDGSIMRLCK